MSAAPPRREQCESPIEALLVRAINEELKRHDVPCHVKQQIGHGPYRIDIAVHCLGFFLIVECDGAAYHAANKDQVERDKRRDRYFAARHFAVMRFTGSEISRCAKSCATEVGLWIESVASLRKAAIMQKWERGELTRLEACRQIRRQGLAPA